jgi:peptide/nickel transport system permease protein
VSANATLPLSLETEEGEAETAARRHGPGRYVPRWFLTLLGTRLSLIGFLLFCGVVLLILLAPVVSRYSPNTFGNVLGQGPSWAHLFGTDDAGRDVFSETLYGGRFTLAVGIISGLGITVLAIVVGMAAGYIGGWVDDFLSMVMNVFLILPGLPLLIVVGSYVGLNTQSAVPSVTTLSVIIILTGWAWGARVMRAQTLSLRSRDFVDAAKVSGEPTVHIIFRDILPNMLALIVNTVILSTLGAILTATALDFLGVGAGQVTWGSILNYAAAQGVIFGGEWWVFIFPGIAISLTIMALTLMNYGVDAIANPRLRRVKAPKPPRGGGFLVVPESGTLEAAS